MTQVVFCHGLESSPHGRKYRALVDAGFSVKSPDCRGMDLKQRVDILKVWLDDDDDIVVVGSSYGGIAAILAVMDTYAHGANDDTPTIKGLVLCAPAFKVSEVDGVDLSTPVPTTIIHGRHDDVVPISVSRDFVKQHQTVRLLEVDDEHRLTNSLDVIIDAVRGYA